MNTNVIKYYFAVAVGVLCAWTSDIIGLAFRDNPWLYWPVTMLVLGGFLMGGAAIYDRIKD